ncbi:MAG TPA: hypothetical protein VJZ71_01185 [Phycisphaerae bacterium]|nr:hypothetical protein [Phycisphaerae bacterium]
MIVGAPLFRQYLRIGVRITPKKDGRECNDIDCDLDPSLEGWYLHVYLAMS